MRHSPLALSGRVRIGPGPATHMKYREYSNGLYRSNPLVGRRRPSLPWAVANAMAAVPGAAEVAILARVRPPGSEPR
jgi:hypothetical protein